ncbi:MAG: phosphatase PAP2 family protein [Candidatus Magasanikbacteria bacterium]
MELLAVDVLSLCLLSIAFLFLLVSDDRNGNSGLYFWLNLILFGSILLIRLFEIHFLVPLYPLVLIFLLYLQVDVIAENVHGSSSDFEKKVQIWNVRVFGKLYYLKLPTYLSGRFWRETFGFFYFSYYLLLVIPFLWYGFLSPDPFARFSFIAVGIFGSFMAIFIWFPVAGPLSKEKVELERRGFFPKLIYWAYKPVVSNGINSGAFPSSHVGMSVGLMLLISPNALWGWLALGLLTAGIAVSTVYGRFHYAIDALMGALSGFVLYFLWSAFYSFL